MGCDDPDGIVIPGVFWSFGFDRFEDPIFATFLQVIVYERYALKQRLKLLLRSVRLLFVGTVCMYVDSSRYR